MLNLRLLATKYAIPVVLGIALLVVSGGLMMSCRVVDSLSVKIGVLQANEKIQAQATADAQKTAAAALAHSADVEAQNVKLEAKVHASEAIINTGIANVDALEAQLANAHGAAEENVILKQQKVSLREAVNQALGVIADQKLEIASLKLDVTNLRGELAKSAKIIVDQKSALGEANVIIKGLSKKANGLQFDSTIEKVVIVALGAIVAVKVL